MRARKRSRTQPRKSVACSFGHRLLTTSRVVWTDASLSVRAAFTVAELRRLALAAGLRDAVVRRHFPCRMLLAWRRP